MSTLDMLKFWGIGWGLLLVGRVVYAEYIKRRAAQATKELGRLVETFAALTPRASERPAKRSEIVQ